MPGGWRNVNQNAHFVMIVLSASATNSKEEPQPPEPIPTWRQTSDSWNRCACSMSRLGHLAKNGFTQPLSNNIFSIILCAKAEMVAQLKDDLASGVAAHLTFFIAFAKLLFVPPTARLTDSLVKLCHLPKDVAYLAACLLRQVARQTMTSSRNATSLTRPWNECRKQQACNMACS